MPLVGTVLLAAAIPLATLPDPRWKQAGLMLSFLGLGALFGSVTIPETTRWDRYHPLFSAVTAHTAIPLDRVGQFKGVLISDSTAVPGSTETLCRYPLKLERVVSADGQNSGSASGGVLLWVRGGAMLFRGQEVTVSSGLVRSRQPGGFTYTSWAEADHVQGGVFRRRIDSLRAGIFARIQSILEGLDPPVAALLEALLLGRREELQMSLYERFRTSGSLHLLALSGLHLGILYLLLCLLLRFLRDKRLRRLVAGALLLGYVFLVGWRPSLERAAAMFLVAAVGYTLDREPQPLNLLGLAAAGLLLVHPHYAFDLSFQLSFVSLAAILLLSPHLHRIWQGYLPPLLGWPLSISLSAQIGTAPLVLYHFGAIYPAGILTALPLIPLATVFLGAGALFAGLGILHGAPSGLFEGILIAGVRLIERLLLLVYRAIDICLDVFSRLPGLYLSWRSTYWLFFALLLLPLGIELRMRRRISSC